MFIPPSVKWVQLAPRGASELTRENSLPPRGTTAAVIVTTFINAGSRHLIPIRYSRSFKRGKDFAGLSLPKESGSNHLKEVKLWVGLHITSPLTKFGKSNREQELLQMSAPDSLRVTGWLLVFSRISLSNF